MNLKSRFEDLRSFGEIFTAACQQEIRKATGISNFKCFVHDQFEAAFPEDHLTRDGTMMLSLRLSLDLKGFGKASVDRLKQQIAPLNENYKVLRANFADSAEEVDFDWHVTEKERREDEGRGLTMRLYEDSRKLSQALQAILDEREKP